MARVAIKRSFDVLSLSGPQQQQHQMPAWLAVKRARASDGSAQHAPMVDVQPSSQQQQPPHTSSASAAGAAGGDDNASASPFVASRPDMAALIDWPAVKHKRPRLDAASAAASAAPMAIDEKTGNSGSGGRDELKHGKRHAGHGASTKMLEAASALTAQQLTTSPFAPKNSGTPLVRPLVEQGATTAGGEERFTRAQVMAIVNEAVRKREEQLRQEFTDVLNEKLADQFNVFSTFNRDYIGRTMARSDKDSYFS